MAGDAGEEIDLGIAGIGPGVLVGRGGFGLVYRAVQRSSGGVVAVKVLSGHLDDVARSRFEKEAAALGKLRGHPNICTVYDAGVDSSGRPYLVMEYAPSSLAQRLAEEGAMAWPDAAALGVEVAGALQTAHRAGLLHRDVKPENVLLTSFGDWRLADFGLVRFAEDTMSRGITLTASHAAPELLWGAPATVASDVYALGSTLFHALTGHVAFALSEGAHRESLYRRIEQEPVPELTDVPEPIAVVVRRAMAKEPSGRFASASELGEALQDAQRAGGAAVTSLRLATNSGSEAAGRAAVADSGLTVDGATPRVPDELTAAVDRANRGRPDEAVDEELPESQDREPRPVDRRLVIVAAVIIAALIGGALMLGRGGGDGVDTAGTDTSAGSSTTEQETATTLSVAEELEQDLPLIRQFWEDYSEASLSSAEALNGFEQRRNHPFAGDVSTCPLAEADWTPAEVTLDESGVERDKDFALPSGPDAGQPAHGRTYVTPVAFTYPDQGDEPSAPVRAHIAIIDGVAYGFWAC